MNKYLLRLLLLLFVICSTVLSAQAMLDNFDTSVKDKMYNTYMEGKSNFVITDDASTFIPGSNGSLNVKAFIDAVHPYGSYVLLAHNEKPGEYLDLGSSDSLSIWIKVNKTPAHPGNLAFRIHLIDQPSASDNMEEYIYETRAILNATHDWAKLKIPLKIRYQTGTVIPDSTGFILAPTDWKFLSNNRVFDRDKIVCFNIGIVTTGWTDKGNLPQESVDINFDSFVRIVILDAPPALVSPANNTVHQTITPTLNWNAVTGAENYRLQVSTDRNFSSFAADDSTLTTTSGQLTGLSNNTKYYWRVKAKNAGGTSSYSTVWNFTTVVAVPNVPVLTSPVDNAVRQSISLSLNWNTTMRAESYRLQVSTDRNFSSFATDDSTLTTTSGQLTGLSNNTKYYWRVNAKNAGGTSAYSTVWNFTTIVAIPDVPVLGSPVDNAVSQPTTLLLNWNTMPGADIYRLQVSTDQNFSLLVVDDSTLTITSEQLTGLSNNTKYYWRVQAKNAGGTSAYSMVWDFTTVVAIPDVPVPVSPVDNVVDQPTTLSLNWNMAMRAESYRLQVSTDQNFGSFASDDSTIATTSIQLTDLSNNIKYYWRVNAKNAGGTSAYSTVCNFTTIVAVPDVPVPVSPVDNVANQPTTLSLNWNMMPGADSYRLQVSTDKNFGSFVADDSTITTTSRLITGLSNDTKYYWRVNAKNAGGTSAYSTVCNFTTIVAVPDVPVLVLPADSATDQPKTLSLNWNMVARADSYRLQVSTDQNFGSFAADDSTITTTSRLITGLSNDTKYYWRVNAKNAGGTSAYSTICNFTTIVAVPDMPVLVLPADSATDQPKTLSLNWNTAVRADSYRLQVSTDKNFGSFAVDDSTITTTSRLITGLSNDTKYYWRVNAKNAGGTSPYSDVFYFTTIPPAVSIISPAGGEKWETKSLHNITWVSSDIDNIKIEYSINNGTDWITIAGSVSAGAGSYNWTIPDNTSNLCKVRISDVSNGNFNSISKNYFVIYSQPDTISCSFSIGNMDVTSASSFRMTGVPGKTDYSISRLMKGKQVKDWQVYHDNGKAQNYFIAYDGSSTFNLTPGRGFWVISRQSIDVTGAVSSVELDNSACYSVPVHDDWNIISNPFEKRVSWNSIQTINGVIESLWDFTGSFVAVTNLEPYKGYYFRNLTGLTSLRIPYIVTAALGKSSDFSSGGDADRISLKLIRDNNEKSEVFIGFGSGTLNGYDAMDLFKPVADFERERIVIRNDSLETAYKYLFADYRPFTGMQKYDINLKLIPNQTYTIRITGGKSFDAGICIIDKRLNNFYDMTGINEIKIKSAFENNNYELIIAESSYLQELKQKYEIPLTFELEQNYPNPFNPSTVISYSLAKSGNVKLTVYDLAGKEIQTLVEEYQNAGRYNVRFSIKDSDISSGVYYYTLLSDGQTLTRKLMLLK